MTSDEQATLPPVTLAHRMRAFGILQMKGWSYDAAMADPLRGRVIEAVAASIRTAQWREAHTQTQTLVRRLNPKTGAWCTQRVPGAYNTRQSAMALAQSGAGTDYAINILRCALRTCAAALDAFINAGDAAGGPIDWDELAEITEFAHAALDETDPAARAAGEGSTS